MNDTGNFIRVLVVDDSAFMRTALRRMIESDPGLRVIDTASDGIEGVEKAIQLRPDVITMDIEMPRMTGLDALSRIMDVAPCPVIMVSSLTRHHAEATIEALHRGAYDFLSKDLSYASLDIVRIKDDLVDKCKAAARLSRRRPASASSPAAQRNSIAAATAPAIPKSMLRHKLIHVPQIVCIGTSTGGPKALQRILPMLPMGFPAPIVIVQHMPPGFTEPFARRLDSLCHLHVKESEPNETLQAGTIYIARAGEHLRIVRKGTSASAQMSVDPADSAHIPSVDVMMLSAAAQFSSRAMGVILTGMGCDGLQGMTAIQRAGGYTVGEDEQSCVVYGMPRACAEAGVVRTVLPLDNIPGEMVRAVEATTAARA
ncbi:MAG: chemotaxis response regulator protein-glutamate methylesterase [Acidobacteriota bacterium]|nr:chemotaxis response regulator protein-glutamate methylesterase [Acidobacteriota bacterium]